MRENYQSIMHILNYIGKLYSCHSGMLLFKSEKKIIREDMTLNNFYNHQVALI